MATGTIYPNTYRIVELLSLIYSRGIVDVLGFFINLGPYAFQCNPNEVGRADRTRTHRLPHRTSNPSNSDRVYCVGGGPIGQTHSTFISTLSSACLPLKYPIRICKYRIPPNCSTGCLDQFLTGCYN